jgi:ABC-2 type transport system permease protein
MRRALALWRLYLKNSFGLSGFRLGFGKKGERAKWLVFLLLLPSIAGFLTIIYQFFAGIYGTLPPGHEASGLTLAFLFTAVLVFVFGIIYLLSAFFFSQDLERLLPLPIKPSEIVGAKLASALVSEYLTLLPLLLPAFIAWVQIFPDPLFWPRALISFLLAPIIPLALAAVAGLLIMRFMNLPRGRDLWRTVGILLSVAVAFGFQFIAMRAQRGLSQEELAKLLLAPNGLMNLLARGYTPALWATRFLAQGSPVAWLKLLLTSSVAVFLVLVIAERFFLGGVVGAGEVSKRRKASPLPSFKPRGTMAALLWREGALFLRNPVFLTNGILNLVVPPVLILFMAGKSLVGISPPQLYLELIAIGYLAALPALSVLPATSISREGRQFWLSKLVPVSPERQVLAKLIWSSLATLLGGILSLVVLGVLFKLPLLVLLRALVVGFMGSIGVGTLSILMDLLWPNLQWTDPQKAMKGNLTGLYAMLAAAIYLGGMVLLTVKLIGTGWPGGAILAVIAGIFLLADLLFWQLVAKRAHVSYWQE